MYTRGRVLVDTKRDARAPKLEFFDRVLGMNPSHTVAVDFSAAVASTPNDRGMQIQSRTELKFKGGGGYRPINLLKNSNFFQIVRCMENAI